MNSRAARRQTELTRLLTTAEALRLNGQPLGDELWLELGQAGANLDDLQTLAETEFEEENSSPLIHLLSTSTGRVPEVLKQLLLRGLLEGTLSVTVGHLTIAASVVPLRARRQVLSAQTLADVLGALLETPQARQGEWSELLCAALINVLQAQPVNTQDFPGGRYALLNVLRRVLDQPYTGLSMKMLLVILTWKDPDVTAAMWPIIEATDLQDNDGFLRVLMNDDHGRPLALTHSPRLAAQNLDLQGVLTWMETHQDALVWPYHPASEELLVHTSPAEITGEIAQLSVQQAARLLHLAWWQDWQGDQEFNVNFWPGATLDATCRADWVRAIRAFPSPSLAERVSNFGPDVIHALIEQDRAAIIRLSLLSSGLKLKLQHLLSRQHWEDECREQLSREQLSREQLSREQLSREQ